MLCIGLSGGMNSPGALTAPRLVSLALPTPIPSWQVLIIAEDPPHPATVLLLLLIFWIKDPLAVSRGPTSITFPLQS